MLVVQLWSLLFCMWAASAAARNTTKQKANYPQFFHDLALSRYNANAKNLTRPYQLKKLQIIRVPKASSTALSIVARRMVGCTPPGPCCKFPGEPAGTCPHPDLANCIKEKKVIGCIGHSVDMRSFTNEQIVSISVVREPTSRSLSAFFYPGMHHNSDCTKDPQRTRLECFKSYLLDRRFRNVVVKMFNGEFAYAKATTCRNTATCHLSFESAKEHLNKLNFVGVTEMWELSLLLLHYRFPDLPPVLHEFAVSESSSAPSSAASIAAPTYTNHSIATTPIDTITAPFNVSSNLFNVRTNSNPEYKIFKKMAMEEYLSQLRKQNELDILMYKTIMDDLCNKLHKYKLWDNLTIQKYWKERSPISVKKCNPLE